MAQVVVFLLLLVVVASGVPGPDRARRFHAARFGRSATASASPPTPSAASAANRTLLPPPQMLEQLRRNTHKFEFENNLSKSVTLAWVGDGTGVVLVLTTLDFSVLNGPGDFSLYRSENYGKNFTDITNLISGNNVESELGILVDPGNANRVVILSSTMMPMVWFFVGSKDGGRSFVSHTLPFQPLAQMQFHPTLPDVLLAHVVADSSLFITTDFGKSWRLLHQFVFMYKWSSNGTLFITTYPLMSDVFRPPLGKFLMKRSTDLGLTFTIVAQNVYSFGLGGPFLYASIVFSANMTRVVHVSSDQGNSWNIAQVPPVKEDQFYSILAATQDMIFMHVDGPGDSGHGTLYASDDRGLVFSVSLQRHLYSNQGVVTDFTNVTSLRGVLLTSQINDDGTVRSLISFDRGGEWRPIEKPVSSRCASGSQQCSLHILGNYAMSLDSTVLQVPLSEPNAVGIVIAHGTVADAMAVEDVDVYVSDDGGYTWAQVLEGPHHYAVLDSGGLLVAVPSGAVLMQDTIKFSTDEGQTWYEYTFTGQKMVVSGLASEPGAKSMNVSVWGYRMLGYAEHVWVVVTIDFQELLSRDCEDSDYLQWKAHERAPGDAWDGCVLGLHETFLRLRKASLCRNGRDYEVTAASSVACPCTSDDYMCDYGFYRPDGKDDCVAEDKADRTLPHICLSGEVEEIKTQGFRKIPGDRCVGGVEHTRQLITINKTCTYSLLRTLVAPTTAQMSTHTGIVLAVTTILSLVLLLSGLLLWRRMCKRSPYVFKYSELKQNEEETEQDEHLLNVDVAAKSLYRDDSDEEILE
ncbi:sortilin isoform X1 [Lampetra fluviatilis]